MIEILIFWGIPLFFLMTSVQGDFFRNWRFLLVLSLAGYLALWCFPLFCDLLMTCVPKELSAYLKGLAFAVPLTAIFIALYQMAVNFSGHGGGGYHLPKGKNLLNPVLGGISGFIFSGLVGYAICLTPFHSHVAASETFQERAVGRALSLTAVIDKMSLQKYSTADRKKKLLSRLAPWKKAVQPEKKEAEKKAPASPAPAPASAPAPAPAAAPAPVQQPRTSAPAQGKQKVQPRRRTQPVKRDKYDLSQYDTKPRTPAAEPSGAYKTTPVRTDSSSGK